MDGGRARVGFECKVVVEFFFDVREEGNAGVLREFGAIARRHFATANFTQNLFPLGGSGDDVGGLQALHRKVAGFQFFVVAAKAGTVEGFLCRIHSRGLRVGAIYEE